MKKKSSDISGLVLIIIFLFLSATLVSGQKPSFEKVKKVLQDGAGFTPADFEKLEKGEIAVREIEVKENREVAFGGILKLTAPRDIVFDAFRRAIERQQKEVADEYGIFRKPPELSDLTRLTIKDGELRSLKDCKPGDCSWSLPSDLIKRFTEEIDWSAPKPEEKAAAMVRSVIVNNMQEYLKNGDKALMVYNDDPEPLSVADEQRSLLENLLWINDFAPEFTTYLKEFPNGKLDGIEDLANWSKVNIGFKPVIMTTHNIFYKKADEDIPQGLIISKQIYANHYFHSSLSLTGIISFPNPDGTFATYVFFVSHSRVGALTGTMGKLARVAVDGEAENKLTDVLQDTKRYTAYGLGAKEETIEKKPGLMSRIFQSKLVWFVILLIGFGAVGWFWLSRKKG